jgi:hypothetical protein
MSHLQPALSPRTQRFGIQTVDRSTLDYVLGGRLGVDVRVVQMTRTELASATGLPQTSEPSGTSRRSHQGNAGCRLLVHLAVGHTIKVELRRRKDGLDRPAEIELKPRAAG